MSAPAPSPYQPSLAPDVPAAPRPPGRAVVWLWAMFALVLGSPGTLWTPSLRDLMADRKQAAIIGLVGLGTALVGLVWAYLTDRFPLLGSRREGHLLLGCAITVSAWAAAPFVPEMLSWSLGMDVALGVGTAISLAALDGAVVEVARRHRALARFAAAGVGLGQVALLMAGALFSLLAARPMG